MLLLETPQLAIYDECYVCAQALHNSFKRLGFILHEVSRDEDELIRFINLNPSVLVFHLDSSEVRAQTLLERLKNKYKKLKILSHTVHQEKKYSDLLLRSGADSVISGHYSFKDLIDKLVLLERSFEVHTDGLIDIGIKTRLNITDPFFKIASDPKKLLLTQLLMVGKSTKTIAQIFGLPETDIEVLRKKVLHDTNCQNVAEYIGKAKDKKIV